jgi:hypothetical protein
MLSTSLVFTAGNTKTQAIETKHVTNRELCAPLQLPIGDDVSALHPLRSSVEVLPLANPPSTEDENTNQPRAYHFGSKAESIARGNHSHPNNHAYQLRRHRTELDLDCTSPIPSWAYQDFNVRD